MTEAQTEAALARIADALGVQPGAAYPTSTRVIAATQSAFDRNLELIDSIAGLSSAEVKGFAEIESFAPYHEMCAFRVAFADRHDRREFYGLNELGEQAYDRGLMAASLCQRLGL
jgi:hypothetical protein